MNNLEAQLEAAAEVKTEDLHLNTAQDLFNAINSSDMLTRLSVLEAIAQNPNAALGLGTDGNQDLIGFLCQELEQVFVLESRAYLLNAICAMPKDPRITATLERIWFFSDETVERISAAIRLIQDGEAKSMAHLEAALLGKDTNRAESIANIWLGSADDSAAVRLRLALLNDSEHEVPSLAQHKALWLAELQAVFAQQARDYLEQYALEAVEQLSPIWTHLSQENQVWILNLAAKTNAKQLPDLILKAMHQENTRLEAIRAAAYPEITAQFQPQLEQYLLDPDPEIQAAAIRAGVGGNNRTRALEAQSRTVRIAAIQQLKLEDSSSLLEFLQDQDWRIRSVAAEQLATFGEKAKLLVAPLLEDPRLEVQMAAARVVQASVQDSGHRGGGISRSSQFGRLEMSQNG